MDKSSTINILLVEDDQVEAEAIERAFRKADISNPVIGATDGLEALQILRGTEGTRPMPRPYLVLLDLNMPRMNGLEFLHEIRQDPELSDSIVFVLTTSNADRDKCQAYAEHIAGYIVKGNAGDDFQALTNFLKKYWHIVEFPPKLGAA